MRLTELLSFLNLTKKKTSKEQAKLFLTGSSDNNIFFANNGMMIRSLYELRDAFITMSDDTFEHHVNSNRNDFSVWIKDIHKDEQLAQDMLNAKNRFEAFMLINKRLAYLEKIIG